MKHFLMIIVTLALTLCIPNIAKSQESYKNVMIDEMIGQMIMIGIQRTQTPENNSLLIRDLKRGRIGGIVLYEKNISNTNPKKKLLKLINHLQSQSPIPLFVSIDEEGGRVNRLKKKYGFPKTVSAAYLGKIDNPDSTRHYGYQTARLLQFLGINMNYAPLVDVNINPKNPVIGNLERSFSSDYKMVARHAQLIVKTHRDQQVIPVIKHFPGHGSSSTDTHLDVTDVSNSWMFEELYPFATLIREDKVPAIMTAHIVNSILDDSKLPATLSKKILTEILRGFLNFKGVIFSDDMQMSAIRNEFGFEETIQLAIDAGVDVLMFANNISEADVVFADNIHKIIKNLIKEKKISLERLYSSYQKIIQLKKMYGIM